MLGGFSFRLRQQCGDSGTVSHRKPRVNPRIGGGLYSPRKRAQKETHRETQGRAGLTRRNSQLRPLPSPRKSAALLTLQTFGGDILSSYRRRTAKTDIASSHGVIALAADLPRHIPFPVRKRCSVRGMVGEFWPPEHGFPTQKWRGPEEKY